MTARPLTLIALALLGVSLGYFLVLLLPVIFVTWLEQMPPIEDQPPVCDPEALSPVWDEDAWIDGWQDRLRQR